MVQERQLEDKILDLTNDVAFRRIFQDEKYKWYLSFLISYCTKIDIEEIYNNLSYKGNNITSDNINKKTGEADILVEVKNMVINIEMNNKVTESLIRKNKYYVSALDSRNTEKSKNKEIKNKFIVQINISTKERIPNTNILMYEIVQMDRNIKKEDVYNNHIIYDINLDYLKNELYNKNKLTREEKRLLIFIETKKENLKEIFKKDRRMIDMVEDLSFARFIKADQEFYESYDHEAFEKQVNKEALEDAKREAIEKGKKEGIKEGIKEGSKEKSISIAKNLLKENIDISIISKTTGLSIDEINSLTK